MKEEEVNRCQIQEWYPKFRSVSMKTIIHELPQNFVEYLLEDSETLILPDSVCGEDAFPNRIHNQLDEEDFQVHEDSEDESEQLPPAPCFPELELTVKESIGNLGGAVMPKLNWSAPKDATWINKTSSRPSTFVLALRKWYPSFHPEMEFRCFVRNQVLVGISQREVTGFYRALIEKKDSLETLIQEFFMRNIQEKFESENYAFDVYVTGDERVKLMDFNPWGEFTLSLLFTWEELEEKCEKDDFEFRILESQCVVRPGLKTAVPYDYLDTSEGSGWDQFLNKAEDELRMQDVSWN